MAAIGVPVATAATASAAAPSTGALDGAWTAFCTHLVPDGEVVFDHQLNIDGYFCIQHGVVEGPTTAQLQQLCDVMGGTYNELTINTDFVQSCAVQH